MPGYNPPMRPLPWSLLALLALATPALAHWADLAVAEVTLAGPEARVALTLPTGLVATADDDRDHRLSAAEVARHQAALAKTLGQGLTLTSDGHPGALASIQAEEGEPTLAAGGDPHTALALTYRWDHPVGAFGLRYALFDPAAGQARCVVTVARDGEVTDAVLTPAAPALDPDAGAPWKRAAGFVGVGLEHILLGFDHVLFLVGLVLLGGGWWQLAKVVTAFTAAHAVTFSLAATNTVAVPARLVESAIAATLVYVAVVAWRGKPHPGGWVLAFAFGLIHGLGFASALGELALRGWDLAAALAGFHVGVEAGQLAIVGLAAGALALLRERAWETPVRRTAAGAVAAAGLFWFVERAFGLG